MSEELSKARTATNEFKDKMVSEIFAVQKVSHKNESDLKEFKDKAQYLFDKADFWNEEKTKNIQGISDSLQAFKVDFDAKFDKLEFDCSQRVKISDMR